uniref:Uncharacterized protein n=1 Tax=Ditylenchus dipsaci TaxID=166011 RepID=A0A915DN29_9BILA
MNSTIFLLGLVVFLVVDLNASKTDELYLPIFSLTKSGINTNSYEKSADGVEQMFGQKVDHFGYDDTTFPQRYFVNKKFANDSKIHFLFVEGRVVADSSRVTNENTSIVRAAKDFKATVWSLEHRFFGKSRPADDTSLSSLYTLTVDQSLADIADFIKGQNKCVSN